jgi:peptide/nickel transport system substrate-binding protein
MTTRTTVLSVRFRALVPNVGHELVSAFPAERSSHSPEALFDPRERGVMKKRVVLLTGAVAAVLLVAASATAKTTSARASLGTPAAAPFAQAWAQVPRTPQARRAANVVVFGAEQDIDGFNVNLSCCNELWAGNMGNTEALHGAFIPNQKGLWVKDLVSSASATKTSLSYTIRPDAWWYWGGKKVPVTYKDFVYTLQKILDPNSNVVGTTGYNQINESNWSHKGTHQITFHWKTTKCSTAAPCGPYANWQSLFSGLYPSFALQGLDFNKIWTNCICGSDGKPVSNGPYYLSNYTKGQGSVLKANPFYYQKAKIGEIDFKLITNTNSEEEAMRGGEVDAIQPTFGLYLQPLKSTPGITFNQIPGYYYEHLEFREGNRKAADSVSKGASNPLLAAPFMRQAIAMGLDRQSIINTVYGALSGGLKPLDNALYYQTESPYKADFAKWDFNPKKALALLAKNCSGGPSSVDPGNSKIWTCHGLPATFSWSWTSGNTVRATSEAIAKAEMKAIGIQINDRPVPANIIFGSSGLPSGDFDIADFAEITTGDPGDFTALYGCRADNNWTGYCSSKIDKLIVAGNGELDPAKRAADFQKADALLAAGLPILPLYQRPAPLIYKSNLLGVVNNPTLVGPFWNIQDWHWK